MKRTILCYGDSNTYGYDPQSPLGGRYPSQVRWPDQLALLRPDRQIVNLGRTAGRSPAARRSSVSPDYGGSEGIYTDISLRWYQDGKSIIEELCHREDLGGKRFRPGPDVPYCLRHH